MPQCTATTLKGARCKNNDEHYTLCHVHRKDVKHSSVKKAVGKKAVVKHSSVKHSSVKHSSVKKAVGKKALKGCVEQFDGRYVSAARKSPSFPANECHDEVMMGRDGLKWVSKATSTGVYRWVKLN